METTSSPEEPQLLPRPSPNVGFYSVLISIKNVAHQISLGFAVFICLGLFFLS